MSRPKRPAQICLICNKSFWSKDKQKTCSHKCGGVLYSQKTKGRVSKRRKYASKEALEKIIDLYENGWAIGRIAKELNTYANHIKQNITWAGIKTEKRHATGERTGSWRGGVTSLIRQIRDIPEYKNWRTTCFKRDNYKCVWCGADKKFLTVDHIKMMALILRENNIKTVQEARECDELWQINNGRSLCLDCHSETDTYLNKGKEKLNSFNNK